MIKDKIISIHMILLMHYTVVMKSAKEAVNEW